MNKRSNKGITLIALVITVIVMLILVGVTIAIALDGGLFGEAKRAAKSCLPGQFVIIILAQKTTNL